MLADHPSITHNKGIIFKGCRNPKIANAVKAAQKLNATPGNSSHNPLE